MQTRMAHSWMLVTILFGLLWLGVPAWTTQATGGACSWNGSVNANWSTPGNWDSGCSGTGGIPGTGDALTFPMGASNTTMNDDLPALTLQGLTFTSSLTFTLNGTNTISLTTGIDVQSGNHTINTPLAIANNGAVFHVAAASNLSLGGAIALSSYNLAMTVDTSAGVTGLRILNTISGNSSSYGKVSKYGTGDLRFIGTQQNSYYDIDLNAGTISTNPSGWTYLPMNGRMTLASGTDLNLLSSAIVGSIAGSGNIHSSGIFQLRQYQVTTFTGDIFGANQLGIVGAGPGQLTINRSGGALSYTGEIYLDTGVGVKLVNTTATLASDFVVTNNSTLELNYSHVGVIKVGDISNGNPYHGTLRLAGTIASIASQITVVTANCTIGSVINSATDYGRINVTSPVDLGSSPPTFLLSGSYILNPGEVFNIIQNTNVGTATKSNATFSGLPQGGTVLFNSRAMVADYQAAGNTTFALKAFARLFLPLIMR